MTKNNTSSYIKDYINNIIVVTNKLNQEDIGRAVRYLEKLKKRKGRLFLLGVGGSAANCSHAVNDFRKICQIEAYTPADNVSELTARTNDDGWESIFVNWLKISRLNKNDILLVLSVGGGDFKKNISVNIIHAIQYAKKKDSIIIGIVSRSGGYTKKSATVTIMIPVLFEKMITPFAESFQSIILHAIVNHPDLCEK